MPQPFDNAIMADARSAQLVEDANKLREETTKLVYQIGIDDGLIHKQEVDE